MKRILLSISVVALVACSSENVDAVGPCGPNQACPAGYSCDEKTGVCQVNVLVSVDAAPADAEVVVAADAPPARADAAAGAPDLGADLSSWEFGTVVIGQTGSSISVTITNLGTAPSAALEPALAGARATAFVIDPQSSCLGAALAGGASCRVDVSFRPDVAGELEATVYVGGLEVALRGLGVTPGQLVLRPTGADLGSAVVGQAGDTASFTVQNGGGAATGPLAVALDGLGAGQFAVSSDDCSGHPLEAMATCTIAVRLEADEVGPQIASLAVTAAPGGTQSAMLTGRGLAPATLVAAPPALDLGTTVVGSTSGGSVTITNTGGVTTAPLVTRFDGPGELSVSDDGCATHALAASASCRIAITASPTSPSAKAATLTVAAGDASTVVPVSVEAVAAGALAIAPPKLEYGAVLIGDASDVRELLVSNAGDVPTGAITVALSGSGSKSFEIVTDTCSGATLAAADSCKVGVRFQPEARHDLSATLSVSATPGGTASSALGGVGQAQAALAGDATTMAFGTIDVGQASVAQTWTVTNGGDVPTGELSTTWSGDTADFTVTTTCAAALAPAASCMASVALAPTAGGMLSLAVAVEGTPGGAVTLMAQGTGRPPVALTVARAGNGSGTVSSTPDGVSCGPTCTASFTYATPVTLVATPGVGSTFAGWSGACSGAGPCLLLVTADQTVGATFTLAGIPLSVDVSGSGTVSSQPAGLTCGASCVAAFDYGTRVTLTATPAAGQGFSGWTGCPDASGATCTVALTQATHVAAAFAPLPIPFTVTVSGGGSVASTPAGIACGSACMASFAYGSTVTLSATPAAHQHFLGWTGACSGASPSCSVTVGIDPIVAGAAFATDTEPFTVTVGAGGTVASSPAGVSCGTACSASFDYAQVVTLSATPAPGWHLSSWGGDCSGAGACSVTMDQPRAVSATFVQSLALTVTPPTFGTVTGTGGISCGTHGSTCVATLDAGTNVTLTATPDAGYRAGAWTGCGSASGATCTLTLGAATTVTQTFVAQVALAVTLPTGGTVTDASGKISCGTGGTMCTATLDVPVTLFATPDPGYRFDAWSGCQPGGFMSCDILTGGAANPSVSFKKQVQLTWSNGGGGFLDITPSGGNCGPNCYVYDAGTHVELNTGGADRVGTWGGACASTPANAPSCSLTLESDSSVSVTFQFSLHIGFVGQGTVSAVTDAGTTSCTGDCVLYYDYGAPVTLEEGPAQFWEFTEWRGDCTAVGASCTLDLKRDAYVTADFSAEPAVTVTVSGGGFVLATDNEAAPCTSTCTYHYAHGRSVTLSAIPNANQTFYGWSGPITGGPQISFYVSADTSETAVFYSPFNNAGVLGGGTMYVSAAFQGVSQQYKCTNTGCSVCGDPTNPNGCSIWNPWSLPFAFDVGSGVTVTAIPTAGSINAWGGMAAGWAPNTVPTIIIMKFGTAQQFLSRASFPAPITKAAPYPANNSIGVSFLSNG